ncbi:MAG TPA: patatin-like phospholipase family protein [Phycisphaerae bacterium]|nr:patatin-like phospholipase family protein [Phycisphaerae bacterium]
MPTNIRTWGDAMSPEFIDGMAQSRNQYLAYYKAHPQESRPATVDFLAISGGGQDGAFGAGLLYGWSQAGDRPQFRLVTGVSTGALIAPFAFLGTPYDEKLKAAYTTTKTKDIFIAKDLLEFITSDSATNNAAMSALLTRWIDADMVRTIAAEHAKGRRLYIATVNLDAERLVIWDMGAIASCNSPRALELFRQVMLASASIPVVFPPVYLNVTANGKKYDEMHVDGGTISQSFLWDAGLTVAEVGKQIGVTKTLAPIRLFVIRNAQLIPRWQEVKPQVASIGPRAIGTLLKSEGVGDLYRLYATSQRDGFDFNVAHIPDDFALKPKEAFDSTYMTALFDVGFRLAQHGYPWIKAPFDLTSPIPEPVPVK